MAGPQIVFVHTGQSWFLPYALHQARKAGQGAEVVLVGDAPAFAGVSVRPIGDLESASSRRFREVFQPMSPNPPEFELMCYLRWFYLWELMRREQWEDALYFDSDVLVYGSAEEIRALHQTGGFECGFSIPRQDPGSFLWTGCGHASYWQTGILGEFCEFCITSYTDPERLAEYQRKMQWQREQGIHGGICDMTTLYLFWLGHQRRICNLAENRHGWCVDHNLATAGNREEDEYEWQEGIKKIRFEQGMPYFTTRAERQAVRAHSLHFQGARKKLMPRYYTGDPFPGKARTEWRLALRSVPKRLRNWIKGTFAAGLWAGLRFAGELLDFVGHTAA